MKKTLAMLLLAAMLFSLAACGGNTQSGNGGADANNSQNAGNNNSSGSGDSDGSQAAGDPYASGGQTQEEENLILGVYSPDTYTYENKFIGVGCKLSEEWDVFDTEEIAQLNGMAADLITDEALTEQMENGHYVQPFYAQEEEGLVTVNITIENLGMVNGALLSEEDYAQATLEQLPSALESMGMSGVTAEMGTAAFAGGERTAIYISATFQDMEFHETLVLVKVDSRVACITAGSYQTDLTGEVLDMFYSL